MNEDKSARYHRLQRRTSLGETVVMAGSLVCLLVTGGSAALRDLAAPSSFLVTVTLYVILLIFLTEAVQLPFAFYRGVTLERRYGLSTQATGRWWLDQVKGLAVTLVLGLAAALLVWSLLRSDPDRWWLWAALAFTAILIFMAQLAPIVLLPLFYDFTPLDRESLTTRLVALAERAGARVLGVFEWRLSDRTKKANAALAGVGRTRRILLSDTLLADHSDDEIEVVLAHELAHHVYRDLWSALALETALVALGFYLTDRVLTAFAGSFGLIGKSDIAALPLLLLTAGAVSIVLRPLANASSRAHERRADRYALEMTKNVPAFVSAMKRLGAQNLAEERPSRLVEVLFYTHPPMASRIEAAQAWTTKVTKTA